MANNDYSILIVQDDPDNSDIKKLLEASEFKNIRYCTGAVNAVQEIENSPVDVLIMELDMADIGGLELAQMVRDADKEVPRFTYQLVVSERPMDAEISAEFEENIDAFFTVDEIQTRLIAQILAGGRMSCQASILLKENSNLLSSNSKLENSQLLDTVTNLGNRKFALQSLNDTIKQIEARGGAVCYLVIGVENFSDVSATYDQAIADEFAAAVSEKIKGLVRPLDVVTYLENGLFGIVLLQPSIHHCTAKSYQRIFDGVSLKAYKTRIGFIDAKVGMSLCASEAETGPPKAEIIAKEAERHLPQSYASGQIFVKLLNDEGAPEQPIS